MPAAAQELQGRSRVHAPATLSEFPLALEGHQMKFWSPWSRAECGRGRRREGWPAASCGLERAPGFSWLGGDDFTPQKCLNQENNPTFGIRLGSGPLKVGRQGVEISVLGLGAKMGGWLQLPHSSGVGPVWFLGFQERNDSFSHIASQSAKSGLLRDSRADSGLPLWRITRLH